MIKEQQHSLNTSNSNAQCQGSQTFSLSKEELSRNTLLPIGTEGTGISSTPLFWPEEHLDGDLEESQYLLAQRLAVDYQQAHCQFLVIHRAQFENHWFTAIIEYAGSKAAKQKSKRPAVSSMHLTENNIKAPTMQEW